MQDLNLDGGIWRWRMGAAHGAVSGAADANADQRSGLRMRFVLEEGERHDLVLVLADSPSGADPPDAAGAWNETLSEWRDGAPDLSSSLAPCDARQSYAVLRGLTSAAGGTVAAATMAPSRSALRRDAATTTATCGSATSPTSDRRSAPPGPHPLLDSPRSPSSRPRLLADGPPGSMPAYTPTRPPAVPREDHVGLPGYPGGADIAGNWSCSSSSSTRSARRCCCSPAAGRARPPRRRLLARRRDRHRRKRSRRSWRQGDRDAGIWELGSRRTWTHSRLICAAGLRALARLRPAGDRAAGPWLALADRIVSDTAASALHMLAAAGSARRRTSSIDAALLTPADPRRDPRPDDPPLPGDAGRGAPRTDGGRLLLPLQTRRASARAGRGRLSLLCGFWLALALCRNGEEPEERPRAGSSGTARPAPGPPGAAPPRSTTSPSASCGATCHRRSCTRSPWNAG